MRTAFVLLAFVLLGASCATAGKLETQDIFSSIPWPDEERAEYVLLAGNGEEVGTGALSATRRDGQFELSLRFEGQGDVDETTVVVDATTMKPISVERERSGGDPESFRAVFDTDEDIVEITEIDAGGAETLLPLRLKEHYYDNESSIFLWRTITFEEGYEASYHSVLANFRAINVVTVSVVGKEEVTVPAGTYQAWRVEIRSGGRDQVAWFTETPDHLLVQYDNPLGQLFQLVSADGE